MHKCKIKEDTYKEDAHKEDAYKDRCTSARLKKMHMPLEAKSCPHPKYLPKPCGNCKMGGVHGLWPTLHDAIFCVDGIPCQDMLRNSQTAFSARGLAQQVGMKHHEDS